MSRSEAAAVAGYHVPPQDISGGVPVPPDAPIGGGQAPASSSPLSAPVQMLGGLWRSYGPTLIAGGAAFIQNQQANLARRSGPAVSETTPVHNQPAAAAEPYDVGGSTSGVNARTQDAQIQSNLARRRSGESNSRLPFPIPQIPMPSGGVHTSPAPLGTSSSSNSGDERDRRYDTISRDEVTDQEDMDRPAPQRSSGSWFPWSPSSKGYERIKSE
jgi:receptor expression-enhancing protein 1/2/3/4